MRKMTGKQLAQWEKTRDIGREILDGIRDIKAGRTGRRYTVESFPIVRAREKSGLSQAQYAGLLGISTRTLQQWEQGRRVPTGAARTLLKIVAKHPHMLKEAA